MGYTYNYIIDLTIVITQNIQLEPERGTLTIACEESGRYKDGLRDEKHGLDCICQSWVFSGIPLPPDDVWVVYQVPATPNGQPICKNKLDDLIETGKQERKATRKRLCELIAQLDNYCDFRTI